VAEVLQGDPRLPEAADPNASIDAVLQSYLARSPWRDAYDLYEGLVGFGVYALERMPRPSAASLLALIVDRLAETAERRRPGIAWRTHGVRTPSRDLRLDRRRFPDWDLGVVHGVPGVIAFLGGVCSAGVPASTARTAHALLEKAVIWLLAQRLSKETGGCFPYAVGPRIPKTATRLAWCYGDPGIAAALLAAARASGERRWEKQAIQIGLHAARRTQDMMDVHDAGLCHGAAGLGHIFHRIHRTTEDERFAKAARFWFARTLAMRGTRRAFGGFAAYMPNVEGKPAWQPLPGFLTGAAGVALALVAATSEAEPDWDRALMISLRPAPTTP
jgi:hypothetical protein